MKAIHARVSVLALVLFSTATLASAYPYEAKFSPWAWGENLYEELWVHGVKHGGWNKRLHGDIAFNTKTFNACRIRANGPKEALRIIDDESVREAAEKYLREAHEVLGLREDLSDLRFIGEEENGSHVTVRFQQTYENLPVPYGFLEVRYTKQLYSLTEVTANILPVAVPRRLNPSLDSEPALLAAINEVESRVPSPKVVPLTYKTEARLVALVRRGVPEAAWEVKFENYTGDWQTVVLADSLQVIQVKNVRRPAFDSREGCVVHGYPPLIP